MATLSNHKTNDKTTRGSDWYRLPIEVISMIIGHLDRVDLKNCRLVDNCTGLQATCRLFRTIHLWLGARSVHRAQAVADNPKLSGFVRYLEWEWDLVCDIHSAYRDSQCNSIDSFESLNHPHFRPHFRDLWQSFSRLNALCETNDSVEKSDGVCMLHGSLPQTVGLGAPPPRSRVGRLLNTIIVPVTVAQKYGLRLRYIDHVESAPIDWDTLCTYMGTISLLEYFKVIFVTRDRDHSLSLLFDGPDLDGRWNVTGLFQTPGGLSELIPSEEELVLGFEATITEYPLRSYDESSMVAAMSRYLMSRSFSRLKMLTLVNVVTTRDELWQFIVRHRETLNSLTFRNVCLSEDVSTGAVDGEASKVGIVKLLREETQFKDLAFPDETTIHARRGEHVDA
ncbi:hypothetical protein LTR46_000914 [Exophiala xenobiotica]|nr:hypothetical protein LTR46_000914 [Exophiala xenobiotica]